jgi:hypothetical protein
MDLSQLQNLSRVTHAADAAESHSRSPGRRTLSRFNDTETDWLKANHSEYTAIEAGLHLNRPASTVRKKCLTMGLQLKYERNHANNTKPCGQKEFLKAIECPVS